MLPLLCSVFTFVLMHSRAFHARIHCLVHGAARDGGLLTKGLVKVALEKMGNECILRLLDSENLIL